MPILLKKNRNVATWQGTVWFVDERGEDESILSHPFNNQIKVSVPNSAILFHSEKKSKKDIQSIEFFKNLNK